MPGPVGRASGLLCAVLCLTAAGASADGPSADSLAYPAVRANALAAGVDPALVETADILAGQGLFAEAASLLAGQSRPTATGTVSDAPSCSTRVQWRISTGADYYHIEDVDTAAMTAEELRDYHRLTETPLSAWARAAATVNPCSAFIEAVEPEVHVTERKAALAVTGRAQRFSGALGLEASIRAEKWFRPGASADSVFAPFDAQPSDMAGIALRVTPGSRADRKRHLRWTMPLETQWRHYRADRPGYESSVEGRFSPALELRPDAFPATLGLDGDLRYEDFYAGADSLDMLQLGARLSAAVRYEKARVSLEGGWAGERYTGGSRVEANDRGQVALRSAFPLARWVEPMADVRYRIEYERLAADTVSPGGYALGGSELRLDPGVRFSAGPHVSLEPRLVWDRRWAGRTGPLGTFLWEARTGWEPQLECGVAWPAVECGLRGTFRWEDVDESFRDALADSRTMRLGGDIAVHLFRVATVSAMGDYELRRYAPFDRAGRVSENVTLSGRVALRF